MKTLVFSIHDLKAENYANPFFYTTKGQASRAFGDLVQDQQSQLNKHPSDYSLFYLGTFDDNTGELVSEPKPELISRASDYIEQPSQTS